MAASRPATAMKSGAEEASTAPLGPGGYIVPLLANGEHAARAAPPMSAITRIAPVFLSLVRTADPITTRDASHVTVIAPERSRQEDERRWLPVILDCFPSGPASTTTEPTRPAAVVAELVPKPRNSERLPFLRSVRGVPFGVVDTRRELSALPCANVELWASRRWHDLWHRDQRTERAARMAARPRDNHDDTVPSATPNIRPISPCV